MKELFKCLKDHKNPFMEELVNSSYQYCFQDEFESFIGEIDPVDLEDCGTEKVVRVCLVDPSFQGSLSWALSKLQDKKLVVDQFGFQKDGGSGIQTENETVEGQARLSDKFTVLINDIGIAMKRLGYALYNGKVYKKCDEAKYTYTYKCDVETFVHSLAGNEFFKGRLLKDMKKIIDTLANPFCEVIRPLTVDYNLIEVSDGKCWSLKERRFVENAIDEKEIGHVTPRAFSPFDATKEPEPRYFCEIPENSLTEDETAAFCEDFLRLLNHKQKGHKQKVPCLIGYANSGKTSLFQPLLGLIHHDNIATITKQKVFNKAMINHTTEVIFIDEASPSTREIDDWKILTQGGYTAYDVKYKTAKSFINRCPMILTAQQKLQFNPADQPAMDRRLRNYTFKPLPNPKKKAAEWLRKHPMECVVWAARKARPSASDQDESSESSGEEDQESAIGDGILKAKEKEDLRSLLLSDILTDPQEETSEIATTADHTSEVEPDSDDDQCTSNLRKALEESSSDCLRHRQIASILQMRVREKEERKRREQQLHQLRRDALVARGVPAEHAELLPMNESDPMPTQLNNDLTMLRRKDAEKEKKLRERKAKEAFEGAWLRRTEIELHDCVKKLQTSLDQTFRNSMQTLLEVLQDKLKKHHTNLGTLGTKEALEERRQTCIKLGLLRERHAHLVLSIFEALPTTKELGESSTLPSQDDDQALFITPVPSREVSHIEFERTRRLQGPSQEGRKRTRPVQSQPRTAKKPCTNQISNYFPSQTKTL